MRRHFQFECQPLKILKLEQREDGLVHLDVKSATNGGVLTTWQHKPDGTCFRGENFKGFFEDGTFRAGVLGAFGTFGKDNERMQTAASALSEDFKKFNLVSSGTTRASSGGLGLSSDYIGPMFS